MLVLIALRNLFRNVRRSVTTLLIVALGIATLYCLHGFHVGVKNQYREHIVHARFGHGQIMARGYHRQVFEQPWEHWIGDSPTIQSHLLAIPGVDSVFPRVTFSGLLTNGSVTVSGVGEGVDGALEAGFFHGLNIISGETLSDQADGVLLGQGLARSLDVKPGDVVTVFGSTIGGSINGVDLAVTGIFHTGAKGFDDRVFRLQLARAQSLLDTQSVEALSVGLHSQEDWEAVERSVKKAFPQLEAIPFAALDDVHFRHTTDWLRKQQQLFQFAILLIIGLGSANVASTAIRERQQEIGNLRVNGESRWNVAMLLAAEGAILGAVGAGVGIVISLIVNSAYLGSGVLLATPPGLTRQFHVMVELQAGMALLLFCVGIVCTCLATLVAAWRVLRRPIAVMLRAS